MIEYLIVDYTYENCFADTISGRHRCDNAEQTSEFVKGLMEQKNVLKLEIITYQKII